MKKDTLGLYGPEDSRYLNLVARRAAENGIKIAWVAGPTPGCAAYIADTDAGWPLWDLSPEEDVDRIQHPGLSCCADGILRYSGRVLGWTVCIIGRGHAVQGLADAMMGLGFMVNQCSSTALDMAFRVARAEIVINSASEVSKEVLDAVRNKTAVFDVGGGMESLKARLLGYIPRGAIGSWNVDELLCRARERIEAADGR